LAARETRLSGEGSTAATTPSDISQECRLPIAAWAFRGPVARLPTLGILM